MSTSRLLSSGRSLARAVGLIAALVVVAPAAAQADPLHICLATAVSQCSGTFDYKETTFSAVKQDLDGADAESTLQIEPGTYSGYNLDGPSDMTIFGDPSKAAYPVITSSTTAPAITVTQMSEAATFTHLRITHAGSTPGTAFLSTNEFELHDVYLDSDGAALIHSGDHGSDVLDDVVATSTATGTSAAGIPLIQTNTSSTQTWSALAVYAADRASGIVARNAGVTKINVLYSNAHGLVNGKGGSALEFIGSDPGGEDTRNPNVTLHGAWLYGGSFGLGAFSTQLHGNDVLATSDGAAPEKIAVASATAVSDPFPPAAVASAAASNLTLQNVTAVAAGAGSDGIVAGSAGGNNDNGFDYAAFATVQNSILRGARADAEVLDGANALSQQGHVTTDHDNLVKAVGANDNITHSPTVTLDATDQTDDPMFVNPTVGPSGDLHVKAGSKTLQAAGFIPSGDTDLDGKARPNPTGTAGDLGAYESSDAPSGPGTPPAGFGPATDNGSGGTSGGGTNDGGASNGGGGGSSNGSGGSAPAPAPAAPVAPAPAPALQLSPLPSNAFTVDKTTVSKTGQIVLSLKAASAGTFTVSASIATTKTVKGKHTTVKVPFGSAKVAAAAKGVTATVKPSSTVAALLRKHKTLKVSVTVTFTPTGGAAASKTATVSVKLKK